MKNWLMIVAMLFGSVLMLGCEEKESAKTEAPTQMATTQPATQPDVHSDLDHSHPDHSHVEMPTTMPEG